MLEEMYGVSKSTSTDFDFLLDRFTRQIAYHGLHEVGQLAVDQGSDSMGCTVVALPHKRNWIIGRNFDFEGGRIFDSEKIMKWVFPERGYSFSFNNLGWNGRSCDRGKRKRCLYFTQRSWKYRFCPNMAHPLPLLLLKL